MDMKNKKIGIFLISYLVFSFIFQPILVTTIITPIEHRSEGNLRTSATVSGTKQWLNNSGFDTTDYWLSENNTDKLNPDVAANINNSGAHFIILGEKHEFRDILGTPNSSTSPGWREFSSSVRPLPLTHEINEYGCNVSHVFDEDDDGGYPTSGDQTQTLTGVQWKRNITLPVNMSEYLITSASLTAIVNGSADTNIETPTDTLTGGGYRSLNDFVYFNVKVSDLNDIEQYEIANNQTVNLGLGNADRRDKGTINNMDDTNMTVVDEDVLIFSLNQVLNHDDYNFTVTLGIDIDCEDNYPGYELDIWKSLMIKSVNLTFTYQKIIDQFTFISWNQDGEKISSLSNYTVLLTEANLNFKYKIDKNWTINVKSPNSEIRILINNNEHSESINLNNANSSYKDGKSGGFDLTPLIKEDVNLSIQVYLADEFYLKNNITISIDNVSLEIFYRILIPDVALGGNGGGGGTKIIRGIDYTPLIISLSIGIIALISIFGAYQKHFKYPPMIRKIRKLKKIIRKGKKSKPLLLKNRKEVIKESYKKQVHWIIDLGPLKITKNIQSFKSVKNSNINKMDEPKRGG